MRLIRHGFVKNQSGSTQCGISTPPSSSYVPQHRWPLFRSRHGDYLKLRERRESRKCLVRHSANSAKTRKGSGVIISCSFLTGTFVTLFLLVARTSASVLFFPPWLKAAGVDWTLLSNAYCEASRGVASCSYFFETFWVGFPRDLDLGRNTPKPETFRLGSMLLSMQMWRHRLSDLGVYGFPGFLTSACQQIIFGGQWLAVSRYFRGAVR
ncbi:hypothetical protein L209DRAFT_339426 [Thermothelomyces heterothallicus CBS 203.75]